LERLHFLKGFIVHLLELPLVFQFDLLLDFDPFTAFVVFLFLFVIGWRWLFVGVALGLGGVAVMGRGLVISEAGT
jgi:hypothetical protein